MFDNRRLLLIVMYILMHMSYSQERNRIGMWDTVLNSTFDTSYNANYKVNVSNMLLTTYQMPQFINSTMKNTNKSTIIRKQRYASEIPSFAFHRGREGVRTLDSERTERNSKDFPLQSNFSYYHIVMEGNNKEQVTDLDRRYVEHDVNKRTGRNDEKDYSSYVTPSHSETTEMPSYYMNAPRYQGGFYADTNPSERSNNGKKEENNSKKLQSLMLEGVNTGQIEDRSRYQDIFYKDVNSEKTYPENRATNGNINQYHGVYHKEPTFSLNVPDNTGENEETHYDRPPPSTDDDNFPAPDSHSSDIEVAEPRAHSANDAVSNYYDFLINEGSYKFWAVFQVITAILLIYSAFAAIYYAKYTFSMMDYPDYLDDGFFFKRSGDLYTTTTTTAKPESFSFLGLSPQTFQRIMNALSSKKYS